MVDICLHESAPRWDERRRDFETTLNPDPWVSVSRLLEEGNAEAAEEQKQRIEQLQRERRKVLQDNNMSHQPRFFKYAAS